MVKKEKHKSLMKEFRVFGRKYFLECWIFFFSTDFAAVETTSRMIDFMEADYENLFGRFSCEEHEKSYSNGTGLSRLVLPLVKLDFSNSLNSSNPN